MENSNKGKFDWISNALMGALMVLTGIMIVFFPKAAMSMILIMAAIIFFVLGFTDMIAAIRYRKDSSGWQTTLSSGIITLLVGIFIGITVYMPVAPMTTVIVLCAWAVLRCLFTLVGVIMGRVRRRGTIISSCVLGLAGIVVFIFRDVIAASTMIIGYVLIGLGAVLMIVGFYRRAAGNEKTEAIVQQQREEKKHEREEKLVNSINEKAHLRGLAEGYDNLAEEEEEEPAVEEPSEKEKKKQEINDRVMGAVEKQMALEDGLRSEAEGGNEAGEETEEEVSAESEEPAEEEPQKLSLKDRILNAVRNDTPEEEITEEASGTQEEPKEAAGTVETEEAAEELSAKEQKKQELAGRLMSAVETELAMEESVLKESVREEPADASETPAEDGQVSATDIPQESVDDTEEEPEEKKKGLKGFFSRF